MPKLDSKALIAALVILGAFALVGIFVIDGRPLDSGSGAALVIFVASPLGTIIGFYFGAHNGNISGMATATSQLAALTSQLANQALEKRAQAAAAAAPAVSIGPITPAAPPAAPGAVQGP